MLKKILSPIVYTAFLPLALLIIYGTTFFVTEFLLNSSRFVELVMVSLILVVGTFLFWISNYVMQTLEKLHKPKIADHLRQASVYYLILVLSIIYTSFLLPESQDAAGNRFVRSSYYWNMVYLMAIFVWAIFINGVFLYKHRKENIS